MEGPPEPFSNYLYQNEPNNDRECISQGWQTFIKKDALFREFPEVLQNDLGIPEGMASNAMGELLQVLRDINHVRDLKGEEFVESWLYHQIGQFLGLTVGDLFASVRPEIKRICNDDWARQKYLKELCLRSRQRRNYQDLAQKIQRSPIYSSLTKPPLKNEGPSESQLQSQVLLIQNMHKDLREEWEQVKDNPSLVEYMILRMMLANFESRNHKFLERTVFQQQQRNVKTQEIKDVGFKIKNQGSMNQQVEHYFEKCKQFFKDKDSNSQFYDNLEALKKQISIVDDFLLKKLIDETEKQNVQDKDIILLIGPTGAGKTTLILWLLGYEMVFKNWGEFKTLTPQGQTKPEHQALLANPGSKSVTRFIYSTNLSYSGQKKCEKLQICDSPGFFDSASTEVDIINGIGMINAIKKCNSVKPVIVFNGQALGDRWSAVKNLGKIVSKLFSVTDFSEVKYNIQFIFNKFTRNVFQQFKAGVKSIIHSLTASDQGDYKYVGFLNHLDATLSRSEDPNIRLVFQPKSNELIRQKWIMKLKQSPVAQPEEIFQYSYSSQSKQKIEKAAQKLSKRIIGYIGDNHFRENIKNVFYYFRKLTRIQNIVTGDIKHIYDQIVKKLETHYQQLFDQFSRHLKDQVMINEANAKTFESMKRIKEEVDEFYKIFSKQLNELQNPKILEQLIRQQEKHLQNQFEELNFEPHMDEAKLKINLEVVKKSTCFSNTLKKNIQDIFDKKYQSANGEVVQRVAKLSFQNFQEAGYRYLKICKWKSLCEDRNEDHYEKQFYDKINRRLLDQKEQINEFIGKKICRAGKQGGNLQIHKISFDQLMRYLQKFNNMESCPFLEGTICKEINEEILKVLIKEGEKIMQKVDSILYGPQINDALIDDIRILIRNRDKLVAIDGVSTALRYQIQNCNDSMRIICQSQEKAISGILASLREETLAQNLGAEVARSYQRIKSLPSLSTDQAFIQKVNEVQKGLRDKMLVYLRELIQKIKRLNRFNIGDKKMIQTERIKSTINQKKKIDFFSSLGLFQDEKAQIEKLQKQIHDILLKPFEDMKSDLQKVVPAMPKTYEEDINKSNLVSITLAKYQNFLLYKNTFMEILWDKQSNKFVDDIMKQIIDLSKKFFDLFIKPILQVLKSETLHIVCGSENKQIKFLQRSLNLLKTLKQSSELARYLLEEIGFQSQREYQSVQDFVQNTKSELKFLIQKASREQNQKQMVNYFQFAKSMCNFDRLLLDRGGQSFDSIKNQLESQIKTVKDTSVQYFCSLISDEYGLNLMEIQSFYRKFKDNWQIEISSSRGQGTEAEVISAQTVSILHKYFRNQQNNLTFLLGRMKMVSDQSNISLFANQESSGYLAKVERVRRQISQIIKMFEKEPVKGQFESYLSYIKTESLVEYQKEIDGQITEIRERIEEFRLKEIRNRLRKLKQVESQIRNTMGQQIWNKRLVNLKAKIEKDSKIEQEQPCRFVYEYLEQYYRFKDKKKSQILKFENRSDLSIKGIINIYNELQKPQRDNSKTKIEILLAEMQQQIDNGWKSGKKNVSQQIGLNGILKNIPNEIWLKFSRDLEQRKKNIQDQFNKFEKQIITKIWEDRVDFQTDLIKPFKLIQEGADANLLEKYSSLTRQYFKRHEVILSRISTLSELLIFFKQKILILRPHILQNDNRLQQPKTQYIDFESKIGVRLSQLLRKKNIKQVQNYLQKGKISDFASIEEQIRQIFAAYDDIRLQKNQRFQDQVMKFVKSITQQYEKFTIEWSRDVNSEFEGPKNILTQKLKKYIKHSEVVTILRKQIKSKGQFSEINDVLIKDKIKEILNALGQRIKDIILKIENIKFYSDQLKSMNQIQLTKYLQDYQKKLQKLKKFKQLFVEQLANLLQIPIKIQDLQKNIIDQWQRQNNFILIAIEQFLKDTDKDMSDISNHCNVLDLVFKVVKQKKISPLWLKCERLNELSLTKQIYKFISDLQNKCNQSLKKIIQATEKIQKDIHQEQLEFRRRLKNSRGQEENDQKEKIDRFRREIQADTSLKPEERNQKIQAIIDNIQKLSNDRLRDMKLNHESLMNGKKNKIIQSQESNLRDIAFNLIKIKRISFYVRKFSKVYHQWMNDFLKQLSHNSRQKMVYLEKYLRETKAEVEVEMIINDSGAFAFIKAETYVRQTKAQGIQYLLKEIPEIRQNFSLADRYRKQYKYYLDEYSRIQEDYKLDNTIEFKRLLAEDIKKKGSESSFKKSVLIAKIFALWSILKLGDEESEIVFSFNPHPAQIMAILFLINCFQGKERIKNRFAEVLTGEGKSVVLAGLCSYLAVCGYKAYCACYSEYLSMRDNQEFRILFNYLGILDKVKYGPFNIHCEDFLNAEGAEKTFKESIKQFVINQQSFLDKMGSFFGSFFDSLANKFTNKDKLQKRVLIIDEVDVFFDEKFYGQIYRPAITLDSQQIKNLLLYIWKLKISGKLTITEIEQSEQFIKAINKYPHLQNLLKNQLNGMIRAAEDPTHSYLVNNECLCYIDNQSISYDINYGFKTVFANCLQYDQKRVSLSNRNKSLKISLIVGQFSYAELPKYFKSILGVSGTINAIPQYKQNDMRDLYDIKEIISIPSIYRKKVVTEGYLIVQTESFDKILTQHIQKVYKENRPVIVFFSGVRQMYRYRSCAEFNSLKSRSYILSEETEDDHRDQIIQRAGQKGVITLITSSFARGTDFKVYEKSVIEAGGLHVIQAYLSMNESDFIQVKGRTARQGKDGSFQLLLKESDLELLEIKYDERQPIINQLRRAWKLNDKKIGETYKQKLIKATENHNENVGRFSKNASQADWIKYILNLNSYEEIKHHHVRTVIGIDGTGSMSDGLRSVLLTIERVVQRISAIVQEQKFHGSQEIEIVIYRNYNSDYELLLQCSGFESSATKLTEFLRKINASGGQGNQALEVLFQYINRRENINQVIVIGDAAPNTPDEVTTKRSIKPQPYWNQHNFPMTTSQNQIKKIIKNKIPIHSFYLKRGDYFKSLSNDTGGHSEQFVLNNPNTEKSLIDFFSVHILKALDSSQKLLNAYQKRY